MSCESWCDRGLPPDGVPGYGFLCDDRGDVGERYRLSAEAMRKRGMILAWCSHECREACITRQGLRDAPGRAIDVAAYNARIAAEIAERTIVQKWCRHPTSSNDVWMARADNIAREAYAAGRAAAFKYAEQWIRLAEGDGVAADFSAHFRPESSK